MSRETLGGDEMSWFRPIRDWAVIVLTVLATIVTVSCGPHFVLCWWLERDVPTVGTRALLPAESSFALWLEQGLAFERDGELEMAAREYQAVGAASSQALKLNAETGLIRVLRKFDDPRFSHLIAAHRWALAWRIHSWLPLAVLIGALVFLNRRRQGWAVAEF
jgi:hypothetical protein